MATLESPGQSKISCIPFTRSLILPIQLNALTVDFGKQFEKTIKQLNEMDDLRSVIITGEGKAFSAGGDIDFLLDRRNHTIEENTKVMKQFYSRYLTLRTLKVPVIAGTFQSTYIETQ